MQACVCSGWGRRLSWSRAGDVMGAVTGAGGRFGQRAVGGRVRL